MATTSQTTLFTERTNYVSSEFINPLRPHISGGHGGLHRYNTPAEQAGCLLGVYAPGSTNAYAWPSQASGSLVDQTYAKLWAQTATLEYFVDTIGTGDTIAPVAGYFNRVRAAATSWIANGGTYPRAGALNDRDVQVGDAVTLTDGTHNYSGYVSGFVADQTAATVGAATANSANHATQSASSTVTQTAGTTNDVTVTDSITSYNGLPTGDIDEVYTITVTQGVTTAGNATTAVLKVQSASGRDDVASVTPAAYGSPTAIGAHGATVTFAHTSTDLMTGQVFTLTVHQAFTAPTATSGGTFVGTATKTYAITVSLGGTYAGSTKPQISVLATDGTDSSGPTNVTAASTAVPIGTQGATIAFNQTALRKGDVYYVVCTAPVPAQYRTLVLNTNLPTALLTATDLEIHLAIAKPYLQVNPQKVESPPNMNWTTSSTHITVNAGMTAFDPTWTSAGTPLPLPIKSATLYAEYREWLATYAEQITEVSDEPTRLALLGVDDVDNPLGYAVARAIENANGTAIQFTAVADPTNDALWTDVLSILTGLDGVYSLVPLTHDQTVLDAFSAHVTAQSDPSIQRYRVLWAGATVPSQSTIISAANTTDGNPAKATLSDDPGTAGTQYTYLVSTGTAKFVTHGVEPGDTVRFLYTVDAYGNSTWQEFPVASVVNEDTLILATAYSAAVSVAQKFEIWRTLTKAQVASNVVAQINHYDSSRVRFVIDDGGLEVDRMFLAAGLAAYSGAVAPHQGLRGAAFTGFDSVWSGVAFFNNANLSAIEAAGGFVVRQDGPGGSLYVYRALTTDQSTKANGEELAVRVKDAFELYLYGRAKPYFGVTNVTNAGIQVFQTALTSACQYAQNQTYIPRIGAMASGASVTSAQASAVLPDVIVAQVSATLPFPVNDVTITLSS